jgi:hypothetical protein
MSCLSGALFRPQKPVRTRTGFGASNEASGQETLAWSQVREFPDQLKYKQAFDLVFIILYGGLRTYRFEILFTLAVWQSCQHHGCRLPLHVRAILASGTDRR